MSTNHTLANLVDAARRTARAGRMDDAARAWNDVLALAPDHPEALYFLGQRALAQGDPATALGWFDRAVRAAPKDALIPLAAANAHRMLGDATSEMLSYESALRADPYCFPALLGQGALLEKAGHKRSAARKFSDALKVTPSEERLSPDLRNLVLRARASVAANAEALSAFVEGKLGNLRKLHAGERQDRFDECKDAFAGRKKIYRQEPVLLNFPRVPAIQFYDDDQFPWLSELEAQTDVIENELNALIAGQSPGFRPYLNHPDGVPLNETAALNRSPYWSAYFFWDDGRRVDENCSRCPETAAVLAGMPLARIPGFTPAAFFSSLTPGARIPAHTGVTNARLIVHLGLTVPDRCTFRVGNDTRTWQRGKAWVFDDTIEHEARNDSDRTRIILIFDIWNPYLTAAERDLVCALLTAQREYYAAD